MKRTFILWPIAAPVQVEKTYVPFVNQTPWYIHTLTDGNTIFKHWSKNKVLKLGVKEMVIMRMGKSGMGIPVDRLVDIVEAPEAGKPNT